MTQNELNTYFAQLSSESYQNRMIREANVISIFTSLQAKLDLLNIQIEAILENMEGSPDKLQILLKQRASK